MSVVAVHLPGFRLERCGWSMADAVVLFAFERSADRVLAASRPAVEAGVRRGMTVSEARALLPGLAAERLDEAGEAADAAAVRDALERFTPARLGVGPEDHLLATGPEAMPAIRACLGRWGHDARLAWASDAQAALLVARNTAADVVVHDVPGALGPLPIDALDLDRDTLGALQDVGVVRVSQFAALPPSAVAGRFGPEVSRLHAVCRGRPSDLRVEPAPPSTERAWSVEFDDPVEGAEPLLFALHGLLRDMAAQLDRGARSVTRLQLRFRLEGAESLLPVRLGAPSRAADAVFHQLRARLERVHLASPVVALGLEVMDTVPWRAAQPGLFDRAHAAEALPQLLARLADTLGDEAVVQPGPADAWRPESAWAPGGSPAVEANKEDPARVHEPPAEVRPRPPLLEPIPVPLRVAAAPSGRPRAVLLADEWLAMNEAEGPERLAGEWWSSRVHARDYWRIGLRDGRRAWIFRDELLGVARWWLHGWVDAMDDRTVAPRARTSGLDTRYAELCCRSNYSFTEGASFPEELAERAKELGLHALALTDRDGTYGAVRLHRSAKKGTFPVLHGALLTVRLGAERVWEGEGEAASIVALAQSREGWASLCRLVSTARSQAQKGWAELPFGDLLGGNRDLVLLARGAWPEERLEALREAAGDRVYRAVSRRLAPGEEASIDALVAGAIPCVAVGDVLMHDASRQPLQDVLACIRLGLSLPQAGRRLQPNAERVLKSPEKMAALFRRWPGLVDRSVEIAERCRFSLSELGYRYPREVVPEGWTALSWLTELVRRGLHTRYGDHVPPGVRAQIDHELAVIARLEFPAYFLTVHDLVLFARERGILCQGRGSAANSAVCYVLGITAVDPASSSMLFERFISEERGEPPDIDVDFEHERREEVIQYCYEKYGRDRASMVNEVICYRGRMAVREVGKACGLSLDQVDRLARLMDSWSMSSLTDERFTEAGLDPRDATVGLTMKLANQLQGFPRHTSIHVGGFVISDGPLLDRAPIEPATMEGRTVVQWDKDDVDELGFVKVDLLSLGMLTAIRRCFEFMRSFHGIHHDLASVPRDDAAVYDMLCDGDSIGVFQVESRAQQGMLPRLRPRNFYDLVVEVSIVRPGPIQGGMVHPYLERRMGKVPVTYADPRLEPILARTLGVPIFQEQIMAMAVAVGGFTPGEADLLRRSMGAWRKRGGLEELGQRLMAGLRNNGISEDYAEQIYKQIQGFAEYGFPESHAASFAHLVYVSAWQRCHFPAAFCAALINSQPMGFYAPRTLVADAQRHGVEVRPVDIVRSDWDCTLEAGADGAALRLGLRLVKGLGEEEGRAVEKARREAAFSGIPDLADRARLDRGALRALARADVLKAIGDGSRRGASWEVEGLWPGMFARLRRPDDAAALPPASVVDELQADYLSTGLSVDRHPVGLVRARLDRERVVPLGRLVELRGDSVVRIAGLVGVRQRPDTASGVIFLMLEDETGTANVVVWPKVYQRFRTILRTERLLRIVGTLQQMDGAISVVARHVAPLRVAPDVKATSRDFR
jgi:error-prone DNA polymerase